MSALTPDDVLLGLIMFRPTHGYHLLAYFRNREALADVWPLSASQLYAVLKRLETGGWVTGVDRPVSDAPSRIEYTLTDEGRERVLAWLFTGCPPSDADTVRVEFLCRLFIARLLNLPTGPIVHAQTCALRQRFAALSAAGDVPVGVAWLNREFSLEQLRATLRWIERSELVPNDVFE